MKQNFFRVVVFFIFGIGSMSAFAESDDSSTSFDQCSQYNGYPTYCQNTPGCVYDSRTSYCYAPQNPNPQPSQCSYHNGQPQACNATYGCQYDWRINSCIATGTLPPPSPPPPILQGWCAGGPRSPHFVLGSEYDAIACARQIAAGGYDCAQFASFGVCDTAGYGPGFSADPTVGWCRCDRRSGNHYNPLRWNGPVYRP